MKAGSSPVCQLRQHPTYWKVAVTATSAVRLLIVQVSPDTEPHPVHPPNVPNGVAVSVTLLPVGNAALHRLAVLAQLSPRGELVTVPWPVPANVTVRIGPLPPPPPPPVPVKHVTSAVIKPVTMAPDEDTPDPSLLVCTVADIRVPPQARPVAVTNPVELTVTIAGVLELHVT